MILKVGLRREWPVLHNEAAKYFLVLILKVARSKKLSLVDQCIENVASMAALNTHPPATHPPTRPHLPENIFLLEYVGNGQVYTMNRSEGRGEVCWMETGRSEY